MANAQGLFLVAHGGKGVGCVIWRRPLREVVRATDDAVSGVVDARWCLGSFPGACDRMAPLSIDVKGRHVLLVEDIIDTGHTLSQVYDILETREPHSLRVCALLNKPSRREVEVDIDWVGFDIPDEFVIGYGIDFAQQGRNLPHIGIVIRK